MQSILKRATLFVFVAFTALAPSVAVSAAPVDDGVIALNERADANGQLEGDFCLDFTHDLVTDTYTPVENPECSDEQSRQVRGDTLSLRDLSTGCAPNVRCVPLINLPPRLPLADCRIELDVLWEYYRDRAEFTDEDNVSTATLTCPDDLVHDPEVDPPISGSMTSAVLDTGTPALGGHAAVSCPGSPQCLTDTFDAPDQSAIQSVTQQVQVLPRTTEGRQPPEVHGAGSTLTFFSEFVIDMDALDVSVTVCATGHVIDPSSLFLSEEWTLSPCEDMP